MQARLGDDRQAGVLKLGVDPYIEDGVPSVLVGGSSGVFGVKPPEPIRIAGPVNVVFPDKPFQNEGRSDSDHDPGGIDGNDGVNQSAGDGVAPDANSA